MISLWKEGMYYVRNISLEQILLNKTRWFYTIMLLPLFFAFLPWDQCIFWIPIGLLVLHIILTLCYLRHLQYYMNKRLRGDLCDIEESYIKQGDSKLFVAVNSKKKVIGCIAIKKRNDDSCELYSMSVSKEYRRNGIGGRLMNTALDFCKQMRYKNIHLDTSQYQYYAINFYERLGWKKINQRNDFYFIGIYEYVKQLDI